MDSSYRFNVVPVKEYDLESLITVIKKLKKKWGIKMKTLRTIHENELDEIMDMCNYFFRKKKLEIVEIDVKGENQPYVLYSIDEAKKSAFDWIKAQMDMYGSQIDPVLEASYIKAIQELPLVDSVKGLNEAVANLINYKYIVWYEMLYRPISPGCQPKGFCQYNFDVGRHGIVAYERELTEDELDKNEMREFVH